MPKPFAKGEDPRRNLKGRPKGAVNQLTGDMKTKIAEFVEKKWPILEERFDKMNPRDQSRVLIELLPYIIPKLQAVEMDLELQSLSHEQLMIIVNSLISKHDER